MCTETRIQNLESDVFGDACWMFADSRDTMSRRNKSLEDHQQTLAEDVYVGEVWILGMKLQIETSPNI